MDIEQTRQQAQDENTAPEVLAELAKSEDSITRKYVASNPNTPLKTLEILGKEFPVTIQIAKNPAMNTEQTRQQARDENTAQEVLAELAKSEDKTTRKHVAGNPNTPIETLEILGKDFPDEIIGNPIFNLFLLENPSSYFIRLSLARSFKTSEETLIRLSKDVDNRVRLEVAKNPNTPPNNLAILAKDSCNPVRSGVAENINTPSNILGILAKNSSNYVRRSISRNVNALPESLALLAKDSDFAVRSGVAENINTPSNILGILAKDFSHSVRSGVAKNTNTPLESLALLAKDSRMKVRMGVAKNINTSLATLRELLQDKIDEIRKAAKENLETREKANI